MRKSILVLEESNIVHELFESALPEGKWVWEIHHESSPDKYLQVVQSLKPDVIFLSNQDQKRGYPVVKGLNKNIELSKIPLILLTITRDQLNEAFLEAKGVAGFIRKPFESTVLLDQLEAVLDQSKSGQKYNPALDNIEVIDDELRDLLSDSSKKEGISLDSLEEELDPTDQLDPVNEQFVEPIENEDFDLSDEDDYGEEQGLEDDDEEIIVTEDTDVSPLLDEEDEIFTSDNSIDYDLEEEEDQIQQIDTYSPKGDDTNKHDVFQISVVIDPTLSNPNPLLNESEDKEFKGFTDLEVRLFKPGTPKSELALKLETDRMEQYENTDLEEDEYLDVDDYDDDAGGFEEDENNLDEVYEEDVNAIEAFESDMDIPNNLDNSEYLDDGDESDIGNGTLPSASFEDDILELEIDEFEEDQEDEAALYDNDEVVPDSHEPTDFDFTEDEDEKSDILEPEGVANLDIDFESSQTLLPEIEDDLSEDAQFETEESSKSDAESQQNLQQMINFRHVNKAHYDVSDEALEEMPDQDDLELSADVIEKADEVSIEVSSDVFEMDDFNIENVIDDNETFGEEEEEDEIEEFEDNDFSNAPPILDPLEGADLEDEIDVGDNSIFKVEQSDEYTDSDSALLESESEAITEETEFADPEPLDDFEADESMGAALEAEGEDLENDSSIFDESIENEPEPESDIFDEFSEIEPLDQGLLNKDIGTESTNDDNQENQQYDEIELSNDDENDESTSIDDESELLFEDDSTEDENVEMESEAFSDLEDLSKETDEFLDDQEETIEETDEFLDDQGGKDISDQNVPEKEMDAFDLLKQEVSESPEEDLFEDTLDDEGNNEADLDLNIDTEVLNSQEEFLDYPDEDSVIGAEDEITIEENEGAQQPEKNASNLKKQVSNNLSQNLKSDLSEMIEGIITETIQKTLNETLPELMEKIIQEELENS